MTTTRKKKPPKKKAAHPDANETAYSVIQKVVRKTEQTAPSDGKAQTKTATK